MAVLAMTRDEIIRMAREAGMERVIDTHKDGTRTIELPHPDLLERFAALVAAAERERVMQIVQSMKADLEAKFENVYMEGAMAGAAAEREACAKVCEETDLVEYEHCMVLHIDGHATLRNAAAAIRARGQQ